VELEEYMGLLSIIMLASSLTGLSPLLVDSKNSFVGIAIRGGGPTTA